MVGNDGVICRRYFHFFSIFCSKKIWTHSKNSVRSEICVPKPKKAEGTISRRSKDQDDCSVVSKMEDTHHDWDTGAIMSTYTSNMNDQQVFCRHLAVYKTDLSLFQNTFFSMSNRNEHQRSIYAKLQHRSATSILYHTFSTYQHHGFPGVITLSFSSSALDNRLYQFHTRHTLPFNRESTFTPPRDQYIEECHASPHYRLKIAFPPHERDGSMANVAFAVRCSTPSWRSTNATVRQHAYTDSVTLR